MSRSTSTECARAAGIALLVALAACAGRSPLEREGVRIGLGSGGTGQVAVRSFQERRFIGTVSQVYDFSCGAAAVATLLTHHYQDPRSEQDVFGSMYRRGDQAKIREVGFSLLDMKSYLQGAGYQAEGYKVASLADLEKISLPAIALLDLEGYRHFVVIKGMDAERVWVGDPAAGTKAYSRKQFEEIRDPVLLVVSNRVSVAASSFARHPEDVPNQSAPVGLLMPRDAVAGGRMTVLGPNTF
jgi:predicted double-glycine peptidase